ncbi:Outer membrane protein beta-barrel domain protein [Gemmatirosa kalamazoonensis]|uniref:Outer membrane protein beta-barrel domain protein n=1 Tax=Gemmatirosa kalamazoonensis TaxID=861299 RepID=W0RF14_9BACT|nr:outer membrane beta-barrel protein [Gemmatirosa kalamazoonensis]AHG88925.1 Outer membrane protein beta-barrel domain protein [Gemmatirosa kalamazoonensis]
MTRTLVAIGASLALARAAQAQVSLGLLAGASYSRPIGGAEAIQSGTTGPVVGGSLRVWGTQRVSLQSELLFVRKGFTFAMPTTGGVGSESVQVDYLEVPVMVRLHIPTGRRVLAHVFAGPSFATRVRCDVELAGPRATTSGVCDGSGKQIAGPFQEVNPLSLGLMGGGGGSVAFGERQIQLDLRYGMGLTKVSPGSSARHSTIMLVASFEFGMNDQ